MKQPKWDDPSWVEKARACDDGSACGVNKALTMLSHIDCNTLDRYADTATTFIRTARGSTMVGLVASFLTTTRLTAVFAARSGSAH